VSGAGCQTMLLLLQLPLVACKLSAVVASSLGNILLGAATACSQPQRL
jgi:hypothetical protein